ncbi:hypothetical protein JMUB6875_56440 [Nocardia sp. JMUB6875]|uniref:hypothetical protein n=1 Tax=Nocardia sp. JMUB6875 TaxID=3158170 RepID=UPI0032E64A92
MEDAERLIVIDAANVVGSRPDGWWRDRAGAARRLLAQLDVLRERLPDASVVVVLEGAAKAAGDGDYEGLRLVLADRSGDDAIVDVVAEGIANRPVTVVTADRGLRSRVESLGATTVGPSWLLESLA